MMFNNLIESSSHRKEYKRRGSFFLLTTGTYAILLLISGVASIYAYDARLEDQVYQEVTMLPVPEPDPVPARAPNTPDRPRAVENDSSAVPERKIVMLDVDRPEVIPPEVSAKPNKALPLPDGPVRITNRDWDPPMSSGGNKGPVSDGTRIVPPASVVLDVDPPPPPPPPPANKVARVSREVLKSKAISLPKPTYPALAKQIRLQGTVNVQVLIDETGRVISAQPLEGPPLLIHEAKKAALQARFSPTMLGDQAVKVSGVITYNFVLQQ